MEAAHASSTWKALGCVVEAAHASSTWKALGGVVEAASWAHWLRSPGQPGENAVCLLLWPLRQEGENKMSVPLWLLSLPASPLTPAQLGFSERVKTDAK